jgi:hypothetical protein
MPVNDFAIPRMDSGKQRPIQSMEEARDWERLFIGEIKAGRDPRRLPSRSVHVSTEIGDVATFLDAYLERYVKPAGLRSIDAVCSGIGILKQYLGHLPLSAVEEPDDINPFKTDSDYAEDVELATMHRVLETQRAAINWGMAQTPPLFAKTPFHRFGVRLNKKAETSRDRRLSRDEEKRLLDIALGKMNTPEHQFVGSILHGRIIGALELCCRRGEMLLIQNKRINWDTCQIGIPGATAKDKENRRILFQPERAPGGHPQAAGRSRTRRVRVRHGERHVPAEHPDGMGDAQIARLRRRTETGEGVCNMEPGAASTHRPPMARPATRGSVSVAGRWRRHPDHPADARPREHSADAAVPERHRRGTAERTGGELENQGRPLRLASGS